MGFLDTEITKEDAEVILTSLVKVYASIPGVLRPYIPDLNTVLKAVPQEARKYPLEDIIKLLEWAAANQIVV